MVKSIAQALFGVKFEAISILDYLPHLQDIPVLYFYGKDDLMVSRHEFEIMWNATTSANKTALVTSNPHVWNHLKQKELYRLVVDLFLECDTENFVRSLSDYETLVARETEKMVGLGPGVYDETGE